MCVWRVLDGPGVNTIKYVKTKKNILVLNLLLVNLNSFDGNAILL